MNLKRLVPILIILALVYVYMGRKNEIPTIQKQLTGKVQVATGQKISGMSLDKALMSGKPVIAKLGAEWCPPCRAMAPILVELKRELAGKVIVLDIDVDQNPDISERYNVRSIPLTLFFNSKGQLMTKQVGFMTKQQVIDKLNSY
jgi:thioredoxin 1